MENFKKLGLSDQLVKALERANITKPSEIQAKVIPLILEGKDVIGGSATGSGKTLAFGAGIIERVQSGNGLQVLILVPTRELAEQVGDVFIKYSFYKKLNIAKVYGGVGINDQIRHLRESEIAVATPGRTIDHLERGTISLQNLQVLVLDEADRMLDMGFIKDVEKIIRNCPKERQTLLFSATISRDIEHLTTKYMKNPTFVEVESYIEPTRLKQIYYDVPKEIKFSLLVHLLQKEKYGLVMVFCNTRHNTDFVGNNLRNAGIDSMVIHGGLTQQKRNSIMEKFNDKKVHVLVCTDIASRGLDIKGISHVYNYDIPKTSKDYIHRIGRTARAGKEGIAVNILSDRDYENFRAVLKDESIVIEKEKTPTDIKRVHITLNKPGMHHRTRWDSNDWKARRSGGASRFGSESQHGGRPLRASHSHSSHGSHRPRSSHGSSHRPHTSHGPSRHGSSRPSHRQGGNSGGRRFGGHKDRSRERSGGAFKRRY